MFVFVKLNGFFLAQSSSLSSFLNGSPIQCVHLSTQFGAVAVFSLIIQVIYDVEQYRAQYQSLGDSICDRLQDHVKTIDRYPL